jgi:branched-chain amino acid transport system substrate-binding protein
VKSRSLPFTAIAILVAALAAAAPLAQRKYDPGASDTEIKIGNFMAYTGAFSDYGAIGRAEEAYFRMINDRGGINGRKINFITLDCASDPHRAPELARELVERDQVLFTINTWGSASNRLIRPYMNENKIPQLFIAANDDDFNDPLHFPWTMGFGASKQSEGAAYAKYILRTKPDGRIAVLISNDDSGKEWLDGVHQSLGAKSSMMIVKELAYDYSDPATIDSQIVALKDSGANVFINLTQGRFATQAIRKAYDIGWHPLQFIPNSAISIPAFIEPPGLQKSIGIISNARSKGWFTPQAEADPAVREFLAWLRKYDSQANQQDANVLVGYEIAQTTIEVLKKCGDDLTRANVMKQASHLDLELGMLRPGIKITTSPTDYRPIKQFYLIRFDGKNWIPVGDVITD